MKTIVIKYVLNKVLKQLFKLAKKTNNSLDNIMVAGFKKYIDEIISKL